MRLRGQVAGPLARQGLSSVLDDAPVALLVADGDGMVVAGNRAWGAFSGLGGEETTGEGWLASVVEADRDRLRAGVRVATSGADTTVDVEMVTAAAAPLDVLAHVGAPCRSGGRARGGGSHRRTNPSRGTRVESRP